MAFHDHFSQLATDYATFRPGYPKALFRWLANLAPRRHRAWDAGAGNGQAAIPLLDFFDRVIATDPSAEQVALTPAHPRLTTAIAAETCTLIEDRSIDLVTVAQAAHWFDLEAFYREVRRVATEDGVLAIWCYGLFRIAPAVDAIVDRFYVEEVGADWPPERHWVDEAYRTLPFPFSEIDAPEFAIEAPLTVERLLAYVGTWSAVQSYRKRSGVDPLPKLRSALATQVAAEALLPVRFPLGLRVGRVESAR